MSSDSNSDSSYILENMTEEEIERCYPKFNSTTEYLFVNKCLSLIYGPLPSYAYYSSNNDIENFWIELEDEHYPQIYWYLIENEYIDDVDTSSMKDDVLDFVYMYFENRH